MNAWDRVNKIEAARELGDMEQASAMAAKTHGMPPQITREESWRLLESIYPGLFKTCEESEGRS